MASEFTKLRQTQENLTALVQGIDQMQGMPKMLAPSAVEATADAYAPLGQLEKLELPERVRALGRALRDAAARFAEAPDRETLADWRSAARQLHTALNDYDLRKRARAIGHVPPPVQHIPASAIMPQRGAEDHAFRGGGVPGQGW